jgi:hypothetical protein
MSSELTDLLGRAGQLGFRLDGRTRKGHPRLVNDAGAVVVLSGTPGDRRASRNSLARMERLAGRRLPRPNSGKFRHRSQAQLDTRQSAAELQRSQEVDALIVEADALRRRFAELSAVSSSSRAATEAREVLARFERTRRQLAKSHRIIDPVGWAS